MRGGPRAGRRLCPARAMVSARELKFVWDARQGAYVYQPPIWIRAKRAARKAAAFAGRLSERAFEALVRRPPLKAAQAIMRELDHKDPLTEVAGKLLIGVPLVAALFLGWLVILTLLGGMSLLAFLEREELW